MLVRLIVEVAFLCTAGFGAVLTLSASKSPKNSQAWQRAGIFGFVLFVVGVVAFVALPVAWAYQTVAHLH